MPDIQAGEVEITKEEAEKKNASEAFQLDDLQKDETGELHAESAYTHLGRS